MNLFFFSNVYKFQFDKWNIVVSLYLNLDIEHLSSGFILYKDRKSVFSLLLNEFELFEFIENLNSLSNDPQTFFSIFYKSEAGSLIQFKKISRELKLTFIKELAEIATLILPFNEFLRFKGIFNSIKNNFVCLKYESIKIYKKYRHDVEKIKNIE